jgi:hypothetical protein
MHKIGTVQGDALSYIPPLKKKLFMTFVVRNVEVDPVYAGTEGSKGDCEGSGIYLYVGCI